MNQQPILSWEMLTLKLRNPFTLSYGSTDTRQVFWIRLNGDTGWGEAAIPPYYGVKQEDMIALWKHLAETKTSLPETPAGIPGWIGEGGPKPARCAVELALYDHFSRQADLPLYRLLNLAKPEPKATSFTIAIAEPEEMARIAREVAGYPIIKVKLGSDNDEIRLKAIREARPDAHLYVDANAGWNRDDALNHIKAMEPFGLELIEQPLPKEDFEGLGWLQSHTSIPIVADESVQSYEDVERLAAAGVKAVNLKLMKLGGLSVAQRIVKRVKELGMKLMLGQMIESSLGTTAMIHLSGEADWIDLDAPKLIINDPFEGIVYDEHAVIHLPERPGIGVTLRNSA